MKKLVNFRSFVYSAIFLSITIVSCLIALNVAWLGYILVILTMFTPPIVVLFMRKRLMTFKIVTVISTSVMCVVAACIFFVATLTWQPYELDGKNYIVSGTYDDSYASQNDLIVILRDVELGGRKYPGKLMLTMPADNGFDFNYIHMGERLSFDATVESDPLVKGFEVDAANYKRSIRFYAEVKYSELEIVEVEPSLGDKLTAKVKGLIYGSMGGEYGAIAYAMLTGDKDDISSYDRELFSLAGIAHVLAVSGLHVGLLMGVVTFVMRRLKVKKVIAFVIDAIILGLYVVVADFSPSIIRASVMFLVGGGAMLLGENGDPLNSLGLAMTTILTVNPIMLFDVGFIMSVGAVFGLIIFLKPIESALLKIKLPPYAANAIAVPTAAELGILPPLIVYFGTLPIVSIPVNIVLMPLISFGFILLFFALIISLILPSGVLLSLAALPIGGLVTAAEYVSLSPLAYADVLKTAAAFLMYPIYFFMSDFVNIKEKWIAVSISLILIFGGVFVLFLLA